MARLAILIALIATGCAARDAMETTLAFGLIFATLGRTLIPEPPTTDRG
jgi:hypothetical protein